MAEQVSLENVEFYDINSDKFTEVFELNGDEFIQISPGKKIRVSNISKGYTYLGIADIDTVPIDNPQKVCYLAIKPGTYVNFSNIKLNSNEICMLLYDSTVSGWKKESIPYNPIVTLTEDEYKQTTPDENTIYLIYEPE